MASKKRSPLAWQGRGKPTKQQQAFIKQVRAMPVKKAK